MAETNPTHTEAARAAKMYKDKRSKE